MKIATVKKSVKEGANIKNIKFGKEEDIPLTIISQGDLAIIRGPYSGVHIGILDGISLDRQVVTLRWARTIAEWTEAETTIDIAANGCGASSVFTNELEIGIISDVCCISKVSEIARANLAGRRDPLLWPRDLNKRREKKETAEELASISRGDLVLIRGPYSGVHIGILDEYTDNVQVVLVRYVKTVAEWSESETTIDICYQGAGDSSTLSDNLEVGEISDVCAIYKMSEKSKLRFETQGHFWPDKLFG